MPPTLRRGVVVEAAAAMLILASPQPWLPLLRPHGIPAVGRGDRAARTNTARVSAAPAGDREMELYIFLFGPNGTPTDPREVTATLRLAEQDLGPLPVTLQGMGTGQQMGTIAVPVPGDWTLSVSARTTKFAVDTKDVTLPVRCPGCRRLSSWHTVHRSLWHTAPRCIPAPCASCAPSR